MRLLWHFCLCGFFSPEKYIKITSYECIGIKTNTMQTGPVGGGSRERHFEKKEEALANEQLSNNGRGEAEESGVSGIGGGLSKGWM